MSMAALTVRTWLLRAMQARRIAALLSPSDGKILEAYAFECEARASDMDHKAEPKRLAA